MFTCIIEEFKLKMEGDLSMFSSKHNSKTYQTKLVYCDKSQVFNYVNIISLNYFLNDGGVAGYVNVQNMQLLTHQ